MRWVEAVINKIGTYVTWPIRSLRLDDLGLLYRNRESRYNCQLSYRLTVPRDGSGVVTGVTVTRTTATGDPCDAPLTVSPAATVAGTTRTQVGNDAPTLKVTLTNPGALSVQLPVTGVAWAPIKP
jgi:hypothetical protein